MRRLSGIEMRFLLLAALFILAGADMVLFPQEHVMFHQGYHIKLPSSINHVSKSQARDYGVLAMAVGAVMVGLVFYGRRK